LIRSSVCSSNIHYSRPCQVEVSHGRGALGISKDVDIRFSPLFVLKSACHGPNVWTKPC